jgi:hypothetical protein
MAYWRSEDADSWPQDEPCPTCGHVVQYHELPEPEPSDTHMAEMLSRLSDDACPDCSVCINNLWRARRNPNER